MFDYELVKSAGLKPRHIHRLLNVSRVTASNWLRGATQPHHFMREKTDMLMAAVQAAVKDEKLPVPDSLPPDERSVRTVAVVKRYMTILQETAAVVDTIQQDS